MKDKTQPMCKVKSIFAAVDSQTLLLFSLGGRFVACCQNCVWLR